jgi:hypothetical protein
MITNEFLQCEVAESKRLRLTSPFLRRLAVYAVKSALERHYGNDYSDRCLQSSCAFEMFLNRVGLRGKIWTGAVCYAEKYKDSAYFASWAGFWDQDHHVYFVTQFSEIVDFTISQCHIHRRSKRTDAHPIPPIWWSDIGMWPRVIRYLPEAPIKIGFTGEDAIDLEKFRATFNRVLDGMLEQLDPQDVPDYPLLDGPDTLIQMYNAGDPWAVGAAEVDASKMPYPPWIQQREAELTERGRRLAEGR